MTRGRKPKPTEQKIAEGMRASRINFNTPKFSEDNSPTPPAHLGPYAVEAWNSLYPELVEKGVLKITDRITLELFCESYQDYRVAAEALARKGAVVKVGNGIETPAAEAAMKRQAMTLLLKYATELGITPSSRGRLMGESPKKSEVDIKEFLRKGFNR